MIISLHIGFVEPVNNLSRYYYTYKKLFLNDHWPKEWKSENNSRKPANLHTSPSLRWWTFEIFSFYLYNFLSSSPWEKLNRWDALLTCITTGQCTLLSFLVYGDSVQHLVTIFLLILCLCFRCWISRVKEISISIKYFIKIPICY